MILLANTLFFLGLICAAYLVFALVITALMVLSMRGDHDGEE